MCFSVGRICSTEWQKKRKVKVELFRCRRIGKPSGLLIRLARIVGSSPTTEANLLGSVAKRSINSTAVSFRSVYSDSSKSG